MPVDEGDREKTSPSGMELGALPFFADFAVSFLRLSTAKNTFLYDSLCLYINRYRLCFNDFALAIRS